MSKSPFLPFKQLPPKPNLKHLSNQAKQLLEAHQDGDLDVCKRIKESLPLFFQAALSDILEAKLTLQQAQHVTALEYGFRSWQALVTSLKERANTYDQFAEQYTSMREISEKKGIPQDLPLLALLDLVGDVTGLRVLDAGCGEGYVSRILASRGAKVMGIDISDSLVELARSKNRAHRIDYQVHDLSRPLPQFENAFDLVVGHFVINDVPEYLGFVSTLGSVK